MRARPTTYNGIRMRSRLEASFAAWLDELGWDWSYEPMCFATHDGQYLPDFLVLARGERFYIEVKPTAEAAAGALGNGDIIRASEPDAHYGVTWPEDPRRVGRPHPSTLIQDHYPGYVFPPWRFEGRDTAIDLFAWIEGQPRLGPPPTPTPNVQRVDLVGGGTVWLPSGPEINALLALIHARNIVAPILLTDIPVSASMFAEPLHASAFAAIANDIDDAPSDVAELISELTAAELDSDPLDAVAGLIRQATRRALNMLRILGENIPIEIHQALVEINEPRTRSASIERLTAWLQERAA